MYTYKYDIYSGYNDYLKKTDMYYSGTYEEPAESSFAYSETEISAPGGAKYGPAVDPLAESFVWYVQGRNADHLAHLRRSVRGNGGSP